MANREELIVLLQEIKLKEKMAEENCAAILESLRVNGFHDEVEKIKNDEARHQTMVDQLLKYLA